MEGVDRVCGSYGVGTGSMPESIHSLGLAERNYANNMELAYLDVNQ